MSENQVEVNQNEEELDLKKLIETLVPVKSVVITDVTGEEHIVSGSVSARKQIEIMRLIDEVKSLPAVNIDMNVTGALGIVGILLNLAQDPQVVDALARMFMTAHPQAYNAALENGNKAGIDVIDASDLFAIEELVAAIAPLFVRLAKRTGSAMTALGGAM